MADRFRTPYEGYDVLEKWDSPSWDERTREVVRKRVSRIPERQFLEQDEWEILEAICARLLPQPERKNAVPLVPFIDQKLMNDEGVGYRHESMPELRRAWRLGIAGVDAEARHRRGAPFTELTPERQDEILRRVQQGQVQSPGWEDLPPDRFFSAILLKTVVGIYYAHPAAWSEVGFGGPASPRGYVRRELGSRDRWEAREAWNPVTGGTSEE